ncbi:MAG: PAS domain-containing sensor histidine kinase, partial [Chitinophagaceae bacterium]
HWSGQWSATDRLHYCTARDGAGMREAEERLQKAQLLAKVANFEFDLANRVYTYTSDSMFTLFGIDKKEHPVFTYRMFWNAIHPEDLEFVQMSLLQPEHMYQTSLEYRIVRPNGEVVYIKRLREVIKDKAGQPVKTIGTMQDISDRKKTELALLQSKRRLNALVENGSDLISIVDAQGVYVYVADSVSKILGYKPEDLVGKNAFCFIHPEDQPLVAAALSQVKSDKFVTIRPFRFKNAAGDWRWIQSKAANFIDDPAINGLIVNSQDITEEKIRQDKIRELSLIAEKSRLAIMLSDGQHRITWVNQAFTDLSEYTLEDVIGKLPQDIFVSDEVTMEDHEQIQQHLGKSETIVKEMQFYSKSGRKYWMELQVQPVYGDDGNLIQYLAIGQDISERKNINAQLALSEQKFKALVQNGSDLIVIIDDKGVLNYVSENVAELLSYEPKSLLGKNAFDLVHEEDRHYVLNEFQNLLNGNHETKGLQHRFLKADGSWVWLESKGANHLQNKAVNGILINARDVTERVKLQEKLDQELRNRQKELTTAVINAQEQERSQLGLELHDNVNQILTTVKLYNEMYLSGLHPEKDLIKKSTMYVQECINEIRSISKRLSAPTLGHISLHDSIQELIDTIVVTGHIELLFRPYNIENLCIGKELHLTIYRIVQEGLNNIIKYADARTAIISIRRYEGLLKVMIYDDGKGFDTKLKRKGIGITNMRTRAENMNGSFELSSSPGNGCTIKMDFPLPKN